MKSKQELIFKCIIIFFFILAIVLGVLAVVIEPRNMFQFFIAMVCVLIGNIVNLIRVLKKRKIDGSNIKGE